MGRRIKRFPNKHLTYPIKEKRDIQRLLRYFEERTKEAKTPTKRYQADRDYMIVQIGLNTAFRAEDLLQLRACDLDQGFVRIKENKTGKDQYFRMSEPLKKSLEAYEKKYDIKDDGYLFLGQKKKVGGKVYRYPITRQRFLKIMTKAGKDIHLGYPLGIHGLRKTFGYQYMKNGGNVMTLMRMYNHASPATTMRYVMWDADDAQKSRRSLYIGLKNAKKIDALPNQAEKAKNNDGSEGKNQL